MKLQVKLFGIAREMVGSPSLEMEIDAPLSVLEFKEKLYALYPDMQRLQTLMVAVNSDYGDDHTLLQPKDEIAIIPPVSGG